MPYTLEDATQIARQAWDRAGLPANEFGDIGARAAAMSVSEFDVIASAKDVQLNEEQARELCTKLLQNHIEQSAPELRKRFGAAKIW